MGLDSIFRDKLACISRFNNKLEYGYIDAYTRSMPTVRRIVDLFVLGTVSVLYSTAVFCLKRRRA